MAKPKTGQQGKGSQTGLPGRTPRRHIHPASLRRDFAQSGLHAPFTARRSPVLQPLHGARSGFPGQGRHRQGMGLRRRRHLAFSGSGGRSSKAFAGVQQDRAMPPNTRFNLDAHAVFYPRVVDNIFRRHRAQSVTGRLPRLSPARLHPRSRPVGPQSSRRRFIKAWQ